MIRYPDFLLTMLAPIVWGTTYYVTTEFLPSGYPITVSVLRALPAGLLLLLLVRQLPQSGWWQRIFVLGALNFSIFWTLLFVAAYRLPGGVAATLTAIQPIIVIILARIFLGNPIYLKAIVIALAGIAGVALLVLSAKAQLDFIGVSAGLGAAISMAAVTVLSRRWKPPVSLLTFTAWQLVAGGLLLVPFAVWLEPSLPELSGNNLLGFIWLGVFGSVMSYLLWFRGIVLMDVSTLLFLSPATAVILGWMLLGQQLSLLQMVGMAVVFLSIWLSQQRTVLVNYGK